MSIVAHTKDYPSHFVMKKEQLMGSVVLITSAASGHAIMLAWWGAVCSVDPYRETCPDGTCPDLFRDAKYALLAYTVLPLFCIQKGYAFVPWSLSAPNCSAKY
jgi:hypothetical protein